MAHPATMRTAIAPARIPAPPKAAASAPVSPRNISLIKFLGAPTARIMPISEVRSSAAIDKVLMMMMMATKNSSITNTNSEPLISTAIEPIMPVAFFQVMARTPSFRCSSSWFSVATMRSRGCPGPSRSSTMLKVPASRSAGCRAVSRTTARLPAASTSGVRTPAVLAATISLPNIRSSDPSLAANRSMSDFLTLADWAAAEK